MTAFGEMISRYFIFQKRREHSDNAEYQFHNRLNVFVTLTTNEIFNHIENARFEKANQASQRVPDLVLTK